MKTKQKIMVAFGLTTVFTMPVTVQTDELVNRISPLGDSDHQNFNTLYLRPHLTCTTKRHITLNLNQPPQEPHRRPRFSVTFGSSTS